MRPLILVFAFAAIAATAHEPTLFRARPRAAATPTEPDVDAKALQAVEDRFWRNTRIGDCLHDAPTGNDNGEAIDLAAVLRSLALGAAAALEKGPKTPDPGGWERYLNSKAFFPSQVARRAQQLQPEKGRFTDAQLDRCRDLAEAIKAELGAYAPGTEPGGRLRDKVARPNAVIDERYADASTLSGALAGHLHGEREALHRDWEALPAVKANIERCDEAIRKLVEERERLKERAKLERDPGRRDALSRQIDEVETKRFELANEKYRYWDGFRAMPGELPDPLRNDPAVERWRLLRGARVGKIEALFSRQRQIDVELYQYRLDSLPNAALLHGYFLARHPDRVPAVFSLLFTADPATGRPVLHSAAIVEGRPKQGKAGNVQVLFEPDAEELERKSGMARRLHLKAAADKLDEPEVVAKKTLYCDKSLTRSY